MAMKSAGMWDNDQQRSPRSGTGRASDGKTSGASKFGSSGSSKGWKSIGYTEPTPRGRSSAAGVGTGGKNPPDGRSRISDAKGIQIGDGKKENRTSGPQEARK